MPESSMVHGVDFHGKIFCKFALDSIEANIQRAAETFVILSLFYLVNSLKGQPNLLAGSWDCDGVCVKCHFFMLAVTFLHPHAIIMLPNATPLCHDWSETCLRLTLDASEDGPVIWGQRVVAATTLDHVSLLQKIKKSCINFSPSVCHHVVAQYIPPYAMIGLQDSILDI